MAYTVCLVEDREETRDRLADAVNAHPKLDLILQSDCVAGATDSIKAGRPDVLLTDLDLPDGHGTELIRLAEANGHTKSIVITVFGDEQSVLGAIGAGASGYLLKDSDTLELGRAITDMLNGGSPISPGIAGYLLNLAKKVQTDDGGEEKSVLTKREKDVLQYIVRGFSNAETAESLSLSVHTITTHIKNIYKKLSVNSRGEAIFEAIHLGLLQVDS